jgi:diketogulonate reductase-like aldo/keto reductase
MAYRPLAYMSVVEMASQMGDTAWGELEAAAADAGAEDVRQFVLAWLCKRGVDPVTSCSPAHAASNLAAASLPDHAAYHQDTTFQPHEMVDACGGGDEYAAAFSLVAE